MKHCPANLNLRDKPIPDLLSEEERQVIAGARYVQFSYCWSFVLITRRRKSEPILFMPNEDGFKQAFKYSLMSLLFGWWGFPMGPIWTITSFVRNCDGGDDVTMQTLSERFGQARAASACAKHRPKVKRGPLMRIIGPILFGLTMILFVALGLGVMNFVKRQGDPISRGPGAAQFDKADGQLKVAEDNLIIGSSHDSIELAQSYSRGINDFYNDYLTSEVKDYDGTNEVFGTTFCDSRRDRVVFLVRLPELKGLPKENREAVGNNAWRLAQETIQKNRAGFSGLRVVVGLRSYSVYDQTIIGEYTRDYSPTNSGINSRAFGPQSKQKLVPFFAPPRQEEVADE